MRVRYTRAVYHNLHKAAVVKGQEVAKRLGFCPIVDSTYTESYEIQGLVALEGLAPTRRTLTAIHVPSVRQTLAFVYSCIDQ
jgi:hypothetical protein